MKSIGKIILIAGLLFTNELVSQVVINEVHMRPTGSSTSSNPQNLADCNPNSGGEFIELFNSDPCVSVDISCYIIANNIAGTSSSAQGAFRFPSGTVIPPLGFVSIGGALSGATFVLNDYCGTNNLATHTTGRWYLPNGDGYLMLYDASGTQIDAIYWTTDGNAAKWGTDSDINTNPTLIPSGTGGCVFVSSLSGPANLPISVAEHIGVASGAGLSSSRQTDGSLTWVPNSTNTINSCNSACVVPTTFTVQSAVNQPTCGNADGSIILTPNPTGSYTYTWTPNVSSSNSASNLTDGNYQINVDDGSCSWDTTITLASPSPFSVSASVSQPTCGNTDGNITLTPNPAGSYTYTWTPNVSSSNSASNLGAGSYQINVDDGSCSWDTTITLIAPICGCTDPLVLSIDSTANTLCGGTSDCNYTGPSILINEINLVPSVNDGSLYGETSLAGKEGEWIELYNPNWCDPVDISGYILGSYNGTGNLSAPASNGMGFVLPAGTIVPPLGFVVVRGRNAPVPPSSAIDIVVDDLGGNLCIDGGITTSRIWFQNAGGWFGFYDATGSAQDIVQWGTPTSASDLDGVPCIPSSSSVGSLVSANASGISYNLGATPATGQNYVRIPDGGSWSTITQSENSSYGTCNDLVSGCVIPSGGSSSCNGSATVNVVSGAAGPYSYQWDDPLNQTTATADSLCPGIYNVTVTDASGDCVTSISVEILDESEIGFTSQVTQPSCSNDDGTIDITPNLSGSYTYTWTPNVSSSNSATGLSAGNYFIEASNGTCNWDTTITLNSAAPFLVSSTVNNPSCANDDGVIDLTPNLPGTYTYTWIPNVSNSNSSSTLSGGSYTITVDNGSCNWDTTIVLNPSTPFTVISTVVTPTCELDNGSISIAASVPDLYTYTWLPNVSSSNTATNLDSGNYNITISNGSCSFDTTITLTNSGINPIADFNYTITDSTCSLEGSTTNLSVGAIDYNWYIDNESYSQNSNITFEFNDDQPHVISLEAISNEGCINTNSITINYEFTDIPLFIPNVFTPNNQDGKNDTWYVIGECIEEFECEIFNRWGNKLYTMTDINDKWDGTYNGKEVPQGVYVYVLNVKKKFSPKKIKHGHITKL